MSSNSSQLVFNSLQEMFSHFQTQFNALDTLHNEIGLDDKQKKQKQQVVMENTLQLINQEIATVTIEKQQILQEINNVQKQIFLYKQKLGEFATDEAYLDTNKSLLENLNSFKNEKQDVEHRYNERLLQVKELRSNLETLQNIMPSFANTNELLEYEEFTDVSNITAAALEDEIARCEEKLVSRKETAFHLSGELVQLLQELGLQAQNERDQFVIEFYNKLASKESTEQSSSTDQDFDDVVSDAFEDYLNARLIELKRQRQTISYNQEEIIVSLKPLWQILNVPEEEVNTFLMKSKSLNVDNIHILENEFQKRMQEKNEHLGEFIETERKKLESLWDQLCFSEDQRNTFSPAYTDQTSDQVLGELKKEVQHLQTKVQDRSSVSICIQKYSKLQMDQAKFLAATSNPGRLFDYKRRYGPGYLLQEEKSRNIINKELPMATQSLKAALVEYEEETGAAFMMYTKSYLEVLFGEDCKHRRLHKKVTAPSTKKSKAVTGPEAGKDRLDKVADPVFKVPYPVKKPRSFPASGQSSLAPPNCSKKQRN
ncbi:microtubule associated protein-domain-containing protein [Cokeromyces recurvatus]|uniref:microtubule associated protein-domain-containing protein n=1 Tax=Cokeromyces recurvatus TaxID=90255 RepID=UPI00221F319D|nr:microtubule associated protein-domain-containing protein [Cokeromyces recurvatus]KAI7898460.1 microtubule associated protein-domain-containing protein [Cokeromyces recurvatus]